MTTWTNTAKNTANYTNSNRNSAIFTAKERSDSLSYITTDTPDFVLVGSSEDEYLIWRCPVIWSNLAKS